MSIAQTSIILPGHEAVDGPGLRIHRSISQPGLPNLGPLLLLDHFGPRQFPRRRLPAQSASARRDRDPELPRRGDRACGQRRRRGIRGVRGSPVDALAAASSTTSSSARRSVSGAASRRCCSSGSTCRRAASRRRRLRASWARDMPSLALDGARLRLLAASRRPSRSERPSPIPSSPTCRSPRLAMRPSRCHRASSTRGLSVVSGALYVAENRLLGPHDLARVDSGAPPSLAAMGSAEALVLGGPAGCAHRAPWSLRDEHRRRDRGRGARLPQRPAWKLIDGDRIVSRSERP